MGLNPLKLLSQHQVERTNQSGPQIGEINSRRPQIDIVHENRQRGDTSKNLRTKEEHTCEPSRHPRHAHMRSANK